MAKIKLTSGETIDAVPMLVAVHGYVANSIELTGKDVTAMRRLFERDPAGFRAFIFQFEARFPENRAPNPAPSLGRLGEVKIDPVLKAGDRVISNGEPAIYDGHDFAPVETARTIPDELLNYEAPDFTEDDGYLLEAALQAGSVMLNDDGTVHAFKQEDLLRLIKCAMDRDFTPLWEKPTEGGA